MDIDTNVTGMNFESSKIKQIIDEIISIDLDDNVTFEIANLNPIKEDNEYGGYKFKLIAKQSNIIVRFSVDVSTGDIITPSAIEYKYKTILENNYIDIYTYNYETIIAEKLETILKRNTANSRLKDYYDIYYFVKYKWNEIDKAILKDAINTTFEHRNSIEQLQNWKEIAKEIEHSENLKELWNNYKEKHNYSQNIEYLDTIKAIRFILEDQVDSL